MPMRWHPSGSQDLPPVEELSKKTDEQSLYASPFPFDTTLDQLTGGVLACWLRVLRVEDQAGARGPDGMPQQDIWA